MKRILLPFLIAAILSGCGTARRSEPVAGPLPPLNASVAKGEALFDQHCNNCHQGGEGGLGPAINDKPLPRFLMRFQIRRGLGAMPGFTEEQIGDADLESLIDYLVALRRHG